MRCISAEDLNHADKGMNKHSQENINLIISQLFLEARFCSLLINVFLISAKLDVKIYSLSLADPARYQTF